MKLCFSGQSKSTEDDQTEPLPNNETQLLAAEDELNRSSQCDWVENTFYESGPQTQLQPDVTDMKPEVGDYETVILQEEKVRFAKTSTGNYDDIIITESNNNNSRKRNENQEESQLTNETSVTNTSAPEYITPAEIAKRKREQQNKN